MERISEIFPLNFLKEKESEGLFQEAKKLLPTHCIWRKIENGEEKIHLKILFLIFQLKKEREISKEKICKRCGICD